MITELQKVQIRRHLGFPVVGNPRRSPVGSHTLASGSIGWRFFQVFGMLEYRLNNLQPFEESIILGMATSSVIVSGSQAILPTGLTPQITISILSGSVSELLSYTTQVGDTIWHVGLGLAAELLANVNLMGVQFNAASPSSFGNFSDVAKPPSIEQPFPGIEITCLTEEFSVAVVSDPPIILSVEPGGGTFIDPSAVLEKVKYHGYLPILGALEGKIASSSDNLDTEKADVWTARKDEVEIREKLYRIWRQKLASFLSIPLWENSGYDITRRGQGGRSLVA